MLKVLKRALDLSRLVKKTKTEILDDNASTDGVFLADMTEAEAADWLRDNELGWGKFKDKLKDILK